MIVVMSARMVTEADAALSVAHGHAGHGEQKLVGEKVDAIGRIVSQHLEEHVAQLRRCRVRYVGNEVHVLLVKLLERLERLGRERRLACQTLIDDCADAP